MAAIGKILLSPITALAGAFKKPKAPTVRPTLPLPVATPRANSAVSDALLSRRGSAANMRTGRGGAESTAGTGTKKSLLGQ
jgi:hypothetical protein